MPEPIEWNIAGHVQPSQGILRASGRHHAVLTDMSHHLGVGQRLLGSASLHLQIRRVNQHHRDTTQPKTVRDGQAVMPVEHKAVLAVNHHTGAHGAPAHVHVRAFLDPVWVCGFMGVKLAEVDQGGTKLHATPSVRCDKDMSSRRRTRHGRCRGTGHGIDPAPHVEAWLDDLLAAPDGLQEVVGKLQALGSNVWLVGGCVRDVLADRDRAPHDVDLAVDVEPAVMLEGFGPMAIDTGSAFGTVTLKASGAVEPFQATTLRIDGTYVDGRRPEGVEMVTDIALDVARRDLTINAMAIDLATRGLVDLHGGRTDLRAGRLRAVGEADARLREDVLRVLRVYRFAASPPPHHRKWDIDGPLRTALAHRASGLATIPAERVWGELSRLLDAPLADHALTLMHDDGVLQNLLVDRHPAAAGLTHSKAKSVAERNAWQCCCPIKPALKWNRSCAP